LHISNIFNSHGIFFVLSNIIRLSMTIKVRKQGCVHSRRFQLFMLTAIIEKYLTVN